MSYIEGIKLDHDTADHIALEVLKSDYHMVKDNIRNCEILIKTKSAHDYVHDYVYEDLDNDRELLEAIKRVLEYHMSHNDYKNFLMENK
jgi:hypothetical protein